MARILIVDDEEYVRHFLMEVVERMEHTAVEAENGKEALDVFKNESVDLAIVDINMPQMNGISFLEAAKEIDPHAVVIMMTGYPSADTIIQTIEDDGYTYLAKPMKVERIIDLVERGLEFRNARLKENS